MRRSSLFTAAAVLLLLLVFGATRGSAGPADDLQAIDTALTEGALLVDVRTPGEFSAGHLPGAVNLPLDQLHRGAASLDPQRTVVLYCRSGNRSAYGAELLGKLGFAEVLDLGGYRNGEKLEALGAR